MRSDRAILAAGLTLALFIRLVYVFALPCGQHVQFHLEGLNDEPAHFNYALYLSENGRFPVQTTSTYEPGAFERNEYEYYQPPGYYLVVAGLHRLLGGHASFYAARILSAVLGLACLWLIAGIFRRLGAPPVVTSGAVLFTALYPEHAYFSSVVSNESLSWVMALLLTRELVDYRTLVVGEARSMAGKSLRVLLLLAFGMLVKSSVVVFYAPVIAMYLYAAWKGKRAAVLAWGVGAVGTSLLLIAPWYLRNLRLYGSLTGVDLALGPHQRYLFEPREFVVFLRETCRYFWFPMQHIVPIPGRHFLWITGATLLLANGWIAGRYLRRRGRAGPLVWFLLILLLANIAGFVRFSLWWPNSEGRYFFPSLVAILLAFTIPLYERMAEKGMARWYLVALAAEALWPYASRLMRWRG